MLRIEAFVIVLLKVLEYVLSSQCSGFIKLVGPQNSTIPKSFQKKKRFFFFPEENRHNHWVETDSLCTGFWTLKTINRDGETAQHGE